MGRRSRIGRAAWADDALEFDLWEALRQEANLRGAQSIRRYTTNLVFRGFLRAQATRLLEVLMKLQELESVQRYVKRVLTRVSITRFQ